jgi:hypothetical protein
MAAQTLHTIAKQITAQYGDNIVTTKQFQYLLADFGAFKDLPACKPILFQLLQAGFGTFLYDLKQKQDAEILQKCYTHRQEFLSDGKFRADLTEYVYASCLYALGLIADISEPRVKNPFSAEKEATPEFCPQKQIPRLDLGKMVEQLQNEYRETLTHIIVPDAKDGIKVPGYFDVHTRTAQLVIEEKLRLIGEHIGRDYVKWCQNEKSLIVKKYDTNLTQQRRDLLNKLTSQYTDTFNAYRKPRWYEAVGSFDKQTLLLQNDLAKKIQLLSQLLGGNKAWCQQTLENFLSQKRAEHRSFRQKCLSIASAIVIFVIVMAFTLNNYVSSAEERAKFEETYSSAESALMQGNDRLAIQLFSKAGKEYSASWRKSSYKEKAQDKSVEVSNKIFEESAPVIEQYLQQKDYIQVSLAMQPLADLVLEKENLKQYNDWDAQLKENIPKVMQEEINSLITEIYLKHGKISAESQARIETLLQVDSQNYWLNFIKNKSNE